jgi:AcrR family transcriptional regulator
MDRRVARTRTMLQHALISVIRKKDYEAITISDICDAANVGRSTFYAHYTSKDDLKQSGLDHLRRMLVDRQKNALVETGDSADGNGRLA